MASRTRRQQRSGETPTPDRSFDLITCVHGLHYVGDKLRLIRSAAAWLAPEGLFLAHLDLGNLKDPAGGPAGRRIMRDLRRHGFDYYPGRHLIRCQGRKIIELADEYLGADDSAGPNYTGQPAVDSYYRAANRISPEDA